MFEKILVANRGEIALRIMRSAKRLGIKTVAIYSEADTNSLHVQFADEAYYVGKSPATDSYLSVKNIVNAVRKSGANAVHPGYGFLSENGNFANSLKKEGVTLIGPSVKAIKAMGDKIEAKKIAIEAGVNTVPGYMGVIKDVKQAVEIASDIGFPVMIKAAAGGGGRGMRVVRSTEEVADAFTSASNEAKNSFSDARIFIEKFIENPRHIEIQLLGDTYGNYICLGERECSIQRHHQKVIEEAPSPFIDEETRQEMYRQVVSLAEKVGYYSAGTVEFIVDSNKNFYFLEMNTRLQVEHCVTELVTGIDIVEQMIRIAFGEKLSIKQEDVKLNGWAMESRIYAEDPSRGFLPSSGRITEYVEPLKSPNIRIDSGVTEGSEVSMFYDAMIAKLCTYSETRIDTINHMKKALGDFVIRGISHNISFLETIMSNPKFESGNISTSFIAQEYPDGFLGAKLTSEISRIFLAVGIFTYVIEARRAFLGDTNDPQKVREIGTRWVVSIDDSYYPILIKPTLGGLKIRFEKERIFIESNWTPGSRLVRAIVNGQSVSVKCESQGGNYYLTHAGRTVAIKVRSPRVAELERFMIKKDKSSQNNTLLAPLAGRIVAMKVAKGDEIKVGQELLIIEAMKMENIIYSETAGKVDSIHISEGENVSTGQVLIEYE